MPEPRELDMNFAASGDNIVIPAATNYKIRVHKIWFQTQADVNMKFRDGVGGTFFDAVAVMMGLAGTWTMEFDRVQQWRTGKSKAFVINLDAAVQVTGRIWYTLIPSA